MKGPRSVPEKKGSLPGFGELITIHLVISFRSVRMAERHRKSPRVMMGGAMYPNGIWGESLTPPLPGKITRLPLDAARTRVPLIIKKKQTDVTAGRQINPQDGG